MIWAILILLALIPTAALRSVSGGHQLAAHLGQRIGVPVHILTKAREAELGLLGVTTVSYPGGISCS